MSGGLELWLDPKRLRLPVTCAACDGVATTRFLVPGVLGRVSSISVPVCAACRQLGGRGRRAWVLLVVPAAVGSAVALVVALVMPLHGGIVAALACVAAALGAGGSLWGLHRLALRLGRGAWPPVRIVRAAHGRLVLFCAHAGWGEKLAGRSGGDAVEAQRRIAPGFAAAAMGAGVLGGLFGAFVGWEIGHAQVHVDNAFASAIVIWVDGERVLVVEPNAKDWFSVRYGGREIGYSAVDEHAPRGVIRSEISASDHLYSPGNTACYWRTVSVYARVPSAATGGSSAPVERRELQPMEGVTDWFKATPAEVELDSLTWSKTRTSVTRNAPCTILVARGCGDEVIARLTACQLAADGSVAVRECARVALEECPASTPEAGAQAGAGNEAQR